MLLASNWLLEACCLGVKRLSLPRVQLACYWSNQLNPLLHYLTLLDQISLRKALWVQHLLSICFFCYWTFFLRKVSFLKLHPHLARKDSQHLSLCLEISVGLKGPATFLKETTWGLKKAFFLEVNFWFLRRQNLWVIFQNSTIVSKYSSYWEKIQS